MNSAQLNKLLSPILSTPASNRRCSNVRSNDNADAAASSCFQRTVCVCDWWLVRTEKDYEGKRLAVAGFTYREQQAMRIFTSAPIVKRYDVFTLETADEICIVLKGFINKSRTMENGFLSEVFSHFMFGFPPYWEAYTEKFLRKEFLAGIVLFPHYNKAAADLEFDAGMANPNSNAIPRNHEVNGKHNAGDINNSSEYVSEKTTTNALKSSDLPCHVADHCNIVNAKNHVSKNLLPSTSCDIDNVNSRKDNLKMRVALAIPSSYDITKSSGRMANSKSRTGGNMGTVTKSKNEERASSKDITKTNAASGQSPVPKGSDVDNVNPSNSESAVSLGNSEVALKINSSELKTLNMGLKVNKSSDLPGYVADHNDTGNAKNHASQNLSQLLGCYINNASSLEDNLAVPAEPSSYQITRSSERMVNAKSRMIGKRGTGTGTNSNPKEGGNSEDINMKNAASVESPLLTGSDKDNNNPSNLEPALSLGSSEAALRTSSGSKTSQKQKEIGKCNYEFNCENKHGSTAYEPQDSDVIVRCIGDKLHRVESSNLPNVGLTVMHKKSLFTSSVDRELDIPECVEIHEDHTLLFSAVHSAANVNTFTPSTVHTNTVNTIGSISGNKSSDCLKILNSNQKRCSGVSGSVKHARKNLMPKVFLPEDNLKRRSLRTTIHSEGRMDKLEATESLSVGRSKIGFLSVLPDETSNTVKNDNMCGEPQKPSRNTSVKVNSEPGKSCIKKSQASSLRQNKHNLAKFHSGSGDMNHNYNLKTKVGEEERNVKVGSSREKARKKINFDADDSPLTPKTIENSSIVSPESLSLKRSRSGRLLVPALDFWRNQIAVYDVDRKIIGLTGELETLKPSKGIPPNKRKQLP